MKKMHIKFDSSLTYQQDAIAAVVDIFKGQEVCTSNFTVFSPAFLASQKNLSFSQLGYANKLQLTEAQLLENIQKVQLRHGLPVSLKNDLKQLDVSIEMETGTGKTYVYLRTIMELNRQFGFTKFVVVVPSIPIKEGVNKTLQITHAHFKEHYNNINYKYFVYDSSRLNDIRDFATNDQLQIMVINIDAFRKSFENEKDENKAANIIHRYNDRLGYKPLQLIQDTRPIVIIDEPQTTISTPLAKKAVKNLNPLAILRYSATHVEKLNLLYKLDAVDAYNQQLVKQIEVASVKVEGEATSAPYVKLLAVSNKSGIKAKVEADVRENGKFKRKAIEMNKRNRWDLQVLTGVQEYENFLVEDIYTLPGSEYIKFANGTILHLGESTGGTDDSLLKRAMIQKTIREHLDKELKLNPKGIKVLSLFFIDAVKHYRVYDDEGNPSNGDYANMFEEEYKKLIKDPKYQSLFDEIHDIHTEPSEVHNGYFSVDKKPKSSNKKEKFEYFKDTSGSVAADEDTYALIMQKKEELLSFSSKLRFIFSHSALKEGWDNPNVFQICTLKEAGTSEIRRRQEIGRGLRLAVNQQGERVYGFDVNTLTVMATESYEDFVKEFQKEIEKETGIKFGVLKEHSFNNIVVEMHGSEPEYLGQQKSEELFNFFKGCGYVNAKGEVQQSLKEHLRSGTVELPEDLPEHVQSQVIETLKKTAGKLDIKRSEDKQAVKLNKQVMLSPEFKELWERVKFKTTYSVNFDADALVKACQKHISERLVVTRGKLVYTKADLGITLGGVSIVGEAETTYGVLNQQVDSLPDIVTYLQNETQLTRKSIVEILQGCTNLKYFKVNPQKFIEGCIDIINEQMRLHIVDGIVYTKIGDDVFYRQELFEEEQLMGYLKSNMVTSTKSPYEHVVFDSGIESELAKKFETTANVKVYAKLPAWFKIDTPLGNYNPDWAVLFEVDGAEKLYFVVESKGSMGYEFLRPAEQGKIECGKKHFEELAATTGSKISLEYVSNIDDFTTVALAGM